MFRSISPMVLLFLAQTASADELPVEWCNDSRYQADDDRGAELHLYSQAVEHDFGCEVSHAVTNLTWFEQYEVDYQAAEILLGNVPAATRRTVTRSSWRSCAEVDGSATFTPLDSWQRADFEASVTDDEAPACGLGEQVVDDLVDLEPGLEWGKTLTSTIEDTDLHTRETHEILVTTSTFDLYDGVWEYTVTIHNPTEETTVVDMNGDWGHLTNQYYDDLIYPGETITFQFDIVAVDEGDDPAEHQAELYYESDSGYGFVTIPVIGPADLGQRMRGDVDQDGRLTITDGVALMNHLFLGGSATTPQCMAVADFNEDRRTNMSDAVAIFNYLFKGGSGPENTTADCHGIDWDDNRIWR